MAQLTNKSLTELLEKLGFKAGKVTDKNNLIWEHPESGCILALPTNKVDEAPRPADIVGVRTQLDLQGHLDEQLFDFYVANGTLPAAVE